MSHLKETELLAFAREPGKKRPAHLTTCPACREKLAATERLVAHVQAPFPLPDDLSERTFRALPAPKPTARPLWKPLAVGTAVAALAGVGVFALLPGSPVRPTPSFAQVEKAMREVKTATWVETLWTTPPGKKQEEIGWKHQYWVQLDPPRFAVRPLSKSETYMVVSGETRLTALPTWNFWSIGDAWNFERRFEPNTSTRQLLLDMIVSPSSSNNGLRSTINTSPASSMRRSSWESFQNNTTTIFKRLTEYIQPDMTILHKEEVEADDNSQQILRREIRMEMVIPPRKGMTHRSAKPRDVSEEFRYNVAPPPGTFEIPLPKPGAPYIFSDYRKLPQPDRRNQQAARQALERIARAWSRRDTKAFSAGWDWESELRLAAKIQNRHLGDQRKASAKTKSHWLRAVESGYPFPRWEVENLKVSSGVDAVFVRKSESEPFPPNPEKPQSLQASGTAQATDAHGKKRRVPLSAYFQRQPDGTLKLTSLRLSS